MSLIAELAIRTARGRFTAAHRENEATSESPGAWGVSGTYSKPITATIAVRPA